MASTLLVCALTRPSPEILLGDPSSQVTPPACSGTQPASRSPLDPNDLFSHWTRQVTVRSSGVSARRIDHLPWPRGRARHGTKRAVWRTRSCGSHAEEISVAMWPHPEAKRKLRPSPERASSGERLWEGLLLVSCERCQRDTPWTGVMSAPAPAPVLVRRNTPFMQEKRTGVLGQVCFFLHDPKTDFRGRKGYSQTLPSGPAPRTQHSSFVTNLPAQLDTGIEIQ